MNFFIVSTARFILWFLCLSALFGASFSLENSHIARIKTCIQIEHSNIKKFSLPTYQAKTHPSGSAKMGVEYITHKVGISPAIQVLCLLKSQRLGTLVTNL